MTTIKSDDKRIAIIGLGLLGGSLGMALRNGTWHRSGWARKAETRNWAIANDVIEETSDDVDEILKKADLTVLCLPIPAIKTFIKKHAAAWRSGSIVTDVGSVKQSIVEHAEPLLQPRGVHFVGSHPMAGTEKSGHEAAFPTLYKNAESFVTRTKNTDPDAFNTIIEFWRGIGVKPVELEVEEHDKLVASTSHLLHLLALALTQTALDCPPEQQQQRYSGCATGFRDTSRIASSSPRMWREIIENNQASVLITIKEFEKRWKHLREIIESGSFDEFEKEFAHGKELRDQWVKYKKW